MANDKTTGNDFSRADFTNVQEHVSEVAKAETKKVFYDAKGNGFTNCPDCGNKIVDAFPDEARVDCAGCPRVFYRGKYYEVKIPYLLALKIASGAHGSIQMDDGTVIGIGRDVPMLNWNDQKVVNEIVSRLEKVE